VTNLDRQTPCPSCGASVTFKFAGAKSVVCDYCSAVVARTDRGFEMQGRMSAVLDIPGPVQYGATGEWSGQPFEVIAFTQMDRVGTASAPWTEALLWFHTTDNTTWVANAQGRWYATSEIDEVGDLPAFESLRPGSQVDLGPHGTYVVQEVNQRKVVSGKGSMKSVPKPDVVTRYADISGQNKAFGTIDYGDGSEKPTLFLGKQFDPAEIVLAGGMPLEQPAVKTAQCECPNCGANLPIMSQQTERVVCQYCGTASDMGQGHLTALGPSPKPPIPPFIPIGSRGNFRGNDLVVVGFVIRSCMVQGVQYPWREYLLYGGDSVGYRWLMEEDGAWTYVEPVETGEVMDSGNSAMFRGNMYRFKQSVQANVDFVIGEFYWKVEIGERVEATEFEGPGGKLSREKSSTEVNYAFCSPINPTELVAFGVAAPIPASNQLGGGGGFGSGYSGGGGSYEAELGPLGQIVVVIALICLVCLFAYCGDGTGGGYYGGGYGK
jgi:ribosomal protein S27AE